MIELVPDLKNETREPAKSPVVLPASLRTRAVEAGNYLPSPGLVDAFRAMLLLRRPLLLTGEPGTGKTDAAHYLNWKMGYGEKALRFDAKSTSSARDLFYTYDTIGRFRRTQLEDAGKKPADYIHYNALGAAILLAMPKDKVEDWLPPSLTHPGEPSQNVVLIDEVDKAPRDFPNDMLNELENLVFRVPEFENKQFAAQPGFYPLVVITSNSEKNLPAAFLRRCVYFHIKKPSREQFKRILEARLGATSALREDALDFLMYLRNPAVEIAKRPATAELLDFVLLLEALGAKPTDKFAAIVPKVEAALVTLLKVEDANATQFIADWVASKKS